MTRNEEVESWYRQYGKNILKRTSKRNKQDGEDIFQELALSLLQDKRSWQEISKMNATKWAIHKHYNPAQGYKGNDGVKFVSWDKQENVNHGPEGLTESLYTKRSVELVKELVNSLGGASKQIFEMRFFQDMRYDEISVALNLKHGTARQLGRQAQEQIKVKFNEKIDGKMEEIVAVVPGYDPELTLIELEKRYILKALKFHENKIGLAAEALGITTKTLYNKMNKW